MIRPNNSHSTLLCIDSIFLIRVSVARVVAFVVNECFVQIYISLSAISSRIQILPFQECRLTSHAPLPRHWPEIFWNLLLFHLYSLAVENYNRLNETVDICVW